RLSQIKPTEAECVNGSAAETPASGIYCAASPSESIGNGASFKYWTSLPLATGKTCAGRTVEAVSGKTTRCITAEGTSAGVAQRLQTRIQTTGAGESLFNVKGFLGLSEVKVSGRW